MTQYVTLQYKMLNRQLTEFGLSPWLGYPLGIILFLLVSFFIFFKIEFAQYVYPFLAIGFITPLSEVNRNDFLKNCFSRKKYLEIRLLENALVTIPFVAFLLFKGNWIIAIVLLLVSGILALVNFNRSAAYAFPTPFGKQPFEFTVGFRKSFIVFGFAYFLTFMSLYIGNFNLGIFALLPVLLTCSSFYAKPELPYFVWIFSTEPKTFLIQKMKTALWYSTILSLPILIGSGIFFPEKIYIVGIVQVIGYLFVLTMLLGKYSTFPREMNLPEAIYISIGVMFPPLLLVVMWYFYQKAKNRLREYL